MTEKLRQNLRTAANKHFSLRENWKIAQAPGRINLIGEHTDYNFGYVLPAAIDKYLYFVFSPNQTDTINAVAMDLDDNISFKTSDLQKTDKLWANYLIGLLIEFQKKDIPLFGFDCLITSDVPIGSGMSSSAAFDCSILKGLNELYQTKLENWELVRMSQRSNNSFLGIKSGILDQFSSLFGRKDKVMHLDCDSLKYSYITVPESSNKWLLINTNVKHTHLTSGYNDRVNECQSALASIQEKFPDVKHLSDVENSESLQKVTFNNATDKKRAQFIAEENSRVKIFIEALEEVNFQKCGQILYESHEGLSKKYEVSCPELDFLVEHLHTNNNVLGSRMMGGGFGGCTINLVEEGSIDHICQDVKQAYKKQFDLDPEFYVCAIGNGAEVVAL